MRNHANNYPENLQFTADLPSYLAKTTTGSGYCKGVLTAAKQILQETPHRNEHHCCWALTAIQVSEPVLSNYSEVFPHKNCI